MVKLVSSFLLLCLLSAPTAAQVTPLGGSFTSTAGANTPGCSDSDGGAGVSLATASCSDAQGYTAAGSGAAGFTQDANGGQAEASASASASSIGALPPQQSNGSGTGSASMSWFVGSNTYYSLASVSAGSSLVNFSGSMGSLPPSGILATGTYGLAVSAGANATASDVGGAQVVNATPASALGTLTFAAVGSPTLVRGTVTAAGLGRSGLLVEVLGPDRGSEGVIRTLTGDDGSYLLPFLVGAVTLRVSDPDGGFAPVISPPLTPPTVFDVDLAPAAVPLTAYPLLLIVATALVGARLLRRRRRV